MITPARISPTSAGCPRRLKTSSPSFAASSTTNSATRTSATPVAAANGTSAGREPLGQRAEEVGARDHADDLVVLGDGDDQDAMVDEDLGQLDVGEVGWDVDVLGVHVLGDRLHAAGLSLLEHGVDRLRDEGRVLEAAEVAGKQGGDELAFAEDPGV